MKSESEKLEDNVGNNDASRAETAAESELKVDVDDRQVESVDIKPTQADLDTKTEPTEAIEVEVEEFYVKYKNL